MTYLNFERMNEIDPGTFQSQKPFPWINPKGLLTDEGYWRLLDTLPAPSVFDKSFGKARKFGQRSHDRYNLEYRQGLELPEPWQAFIEELRGPDYRRFLERLYARGSFRLRFHWHYAPNGCSVSPHCDSNQKLGSHLFYLNSSRDWDPAWGGQTLVLDDGGRIHRSSSPAFGDFERAQPAAILDNMSFIFRRTGHSWHGVQKIRCPEDAMRRVFIVVIDGWRLGEQLRSRLLRRGIERY